MLILVSTKKPMSRMTKIIQQEMLHTFSDRRAARSPFSIIALLSWWFETLFLCGDKSRVGDEFLSAAGSVAASSFTRSAYLRVFNECSQELIPGLIIAIWGRRKRTFILNKDISWSVFHQRERKKTKVYTKLFS